MIAQALDTLRQIEPRDAAAVCLVLAIGLLVAAVCAGRRDWREWE